MNHSTCLQLTPKGEDEVARRTYRLSLNPSLHATVIFARFSPSRDA